MLSCFSNLLFSTVKKITALESFDMANILRKSTSLLMDGKPTWKIPASLIRYCRDQRTKGATLIVNKLVKILIEGAK